MKKIILSGLVFEKNLGCPSLLHGMYELLKGEYNIVNIQKGAEISSEDKQKYDLDFETKYYNYNVKKLVVLLYLKKIFKIRSSNSIEMKLLNEIESADLIIDMFGICFCDANRYPKKFSKNLLATIGKFVVPFCGKVLGVKTLKNTASYGPMKYKESFTSARIADKYIFDCFLAREKESEQAMKQVAQIKKPIFLSPDTANLMPVIKEKTETKDATILISVSHQIIKQWQKQTVNNENYIEIIANLCEYIKQNYNDEVKLLPNEIVESIYDDMQVAKDIKKLLQEKNIDVEIIDSSNLSPLQIKAQISSAKLIVASRYHTCVATLSAGVPLLVVGWHVKYEELLLHYNQGEWRLSTENCTAQNLSNKFTALYNNIETAKKEIEQRKNIVKQETVNAFNKAFEEMGI